MKRLTNEEFIDKARLVHGERYDYSRVEYVDWKTNVCIICLDHGEFYQRPNNHLNGKGCNECANLKRNEFKKSNLENFINKSRKLHNNYYEYDESIYNGCYGLVKIKCPIRGYFYQTATNHLSGQGCPKCNRSKGEIKIENWLIDNHIKYEDQKKFKKCRGKKRPLLFDFYLPADNICIEYDGEQHFRPFRFNNYSKSLNSFNRIKFNDNIKNKYCKENNIKLIRIKYTKFNEIGEILQKEIIRND